MRSETTSPPRQARSRRGVSPRAAKRQGQANGIWLCAICGDKVDKDATAYPVPLLRQWKQRIEDDARRRLGVAKPKPLSTAAREKQLKRDLKLRDKMRQDFLKPFDPTREEDRLAHQYQRFQHSKIIVHAMDDTSYPNADPAQDGRRISGWFRVEPFDFYHGGLEVILNLRRGIRERPRDFHDTGRWAFIGDRDIYDPRIYREIQIWVLGRIPWRNIRHYDLHGDNHYNDPHLYCEFANDGEPYEDRAYAELNDVYNWPLDPTKRFEYEPPPEPAA